MVVRVRALAAQVVLGAPAALVGLADKEASVVVGEIGSRAVASAARAGAETAARAAPAPQVGRARGGMAGRHQRFGVFKPSWPLKTSTSYPDPGVHPAPDRGCWGRPGAPSSTSAAMAKTTKTSVISIS